MQIEFLRTMEQVINAHLSEVSGSSRDAALLAKCLTHQVCDLAQVRLQATPAVISAPFTCNIAFVLSAAYRKAFQQEVPPGEFATAICDIWDRAGLSERFSLDISSCGHVNVQPTAMEERRFLSAIDNLSSDQFFRSALDGVSLIGKSDVDDCDNLQDVFSLSIAPLSSETFSGDERYRPYVWPIMWDSLAKKKMGNREVARLIASLAEKSAVSEDASESDIAKEDDRLMLLALLADDELDAAPYLLGELSRQNIPWYLKRFRRDFSLWLDKAEAHFGPERHFQTDDAGALAPVVLLLRNEILSLRFLFRQSLQTRRPELLLGQALDIMRAFYRVYNRPEVRDSKYFHKQPESALPFYSMMHIASRLVWFLLGLTRASCRLGPPTVRVV